MQDELKVIQKRVGTTFVHVTHDQEEAMAIADQIVVMDAGRIEDSGSPERIYLKPKTLFAASFMGEANVLSATVKTIAADTITLESALGVLVLPVSVFVLSMFASANPSTNTASDWLNQPLLRTPSLVHTIEPVFN